MSSATSIDRAVPDATTGRPAMNDHERGKTGPAAAPGRPARTNDDERRKNGPAAAPGRPARTNKDDTFKPWHFFVLLSLLAATAAVVLARQSRPEHLILISIIVGAAGFAAAAVYRTLSPLVSDEAPLTAGEPLTESMRAVLEREKMLTLRSIKELEFDRAMGKVSSKDFEEMAGRLRARAMSLMKQLDAESHGYRELIERELTARVRRAPHADAALAAAAATTSGISCQCGTSNDPDAAFCKRCGSRLVPTTAS